MSGRAMPASIRSGARWARCRSGRSRSAQEGERLARIEQNIGVVFTVASGVMHLDIAAQVCATRHDIEHEWAECRHCPSVRDRDGAAVDDTPFLKTAPRQVVIVGNGIIEKIEMQFSRLGHFNNIEPDAGYWMMLQLVSG